MNRIIVMGRIVNELELKTTPSGVPVCTFRLAVDRNFQKKGEEKKTDFFNIVAWRASAEFVTRYFGKGRLILIEGEMQTRQYKDKNGNPATWYEIVGDNFHFTGEKRDDQGTGSYAPPPPPEPPTASSAPDQFSGVPQSGSDDYPF